MIKLIHSRFIGLFLALAVSVVAGIYANYIFRFCENNKIGGR